VGTRADHLSSGERAAMRLDRRRDAILCLTWLLRSVNVGVDVQFRCNAETNMERKVVGVA
jgi:hypothetical protein